MENLGKAFKEAREDKGLTVKDVSIQTNIGSKFIKAIEVNDFSVFPGEAYTVGFIRNYAEFLKIDADHLIKLFYSNQILESETPIEELVAPTKPRINPIPIILIVFFIAALGVGLYFIIKNSKSNVDSSNPEVHITDSNNNNQSTENQSSQANYIALPLYKKQIVGDKICINVKNKKIRITIKKIENKTVFVNFDSIGNSDFLVNMRKSFNIKLKKEIRFDLERNRDYDFSIGVEAIPNAAQVLLYIKKIDVPYESDRYYDYFNYQQPDQATLTQMQQNNATNANQTQTTTQNNTNTQPNQTQNTQTQQNTNTIKLNLTLTNNLEQNRTIFIWYSTDSSTEIKHVTLAKSKTIKIDANNKIDLDTNNLYGLKILVNGQVINTRTIAFQGGLGKLRFWKHKKANGKIEIKWEINR